MNLYTTGWEPIRFYIYNYIHSIKQIMGSTFLMCFFLVSFCQEIGGLLRIQYLKQIWPKEASLSWALYSQANFELLLVFLNALWVPSSVPSLLVKKNYQIGPAQLLDFFFFCQIIVTKEELLRQNRVNYFPPKSQLSHIDNPV